MLPWGLDAQDASVDLVEVEKTLNELVKGVSAYDKDAAQFLDRKLKPLLLEPTSDAAIVGVFVERLAAIDAANLGAFPEQFGYARSVQAALSGDSLRVPFSAWDAAVVRAMSKRRWARDFAPLLPLGKDFLLDGVFHQTKSVRWSLSLIHI